MLAVGNWETRNYESFRIMEVASAFDSRPAFNFKIFLIKIPSTTALPFTLSKRLPNGTEILLAELTEMPEYPEDTLFVPFIIDPIGTWEDYIVVSHDATLLIGRPGDRWGEQLQWPEAVLSGEYET